MWKAFSEMIGGRGGRALVSNLGVGWKGWQDGALKESEMGEVERQVSHEKGDQFTVGI